jgi:hypothetical protein
MARGRRGYAKGFLLALWGGVTQNAEGTYTLGHVRSRPIERTELARSSR